MVKQLFSDDGSDNGPSSGRLSGALSNAIKDKIEDNKKEPESLEDLERGIARNKPSEKAGDTDNSRMPQLPKLKDLLDPKSMPKAVGMGNKNPKFDELKSRVGNVVKKAQTGARLSLTGAKGFATIKAASALAKGIRSMGSAFMNTQLGQLVEAGYGAFKSGVAAMNSGIAAVNALGSSVAGGISSAATATSGFLGSIGSTIGGFAAHAAAATVGVINGGVNAVLGLFGVQVATTSIVPSVLIATALVTGGGVGTATVMSTLNQSAGCLLVSGQVDQSSAPSIASTSKDETANAKHVAELLEKAGATGAGIAGYLGNAQHESGLNPSAIQSNAAYNSSTAMDGSVNGYAFGFNQWDGGRRVNLIKYAKSRNKDWTDLDTQIDFALNHDGTDSTLLRKYLHSNASVAEIAEGLRADWERGGVGTTAVRQANAQYWYTTLNLSGVKGSDSIISGSNDSAGSNAISAADSQANNNCKTPGATSDVTDGTGSVNATDGSAWAYNKLPADVSKYAYDVTKDGMAYGSSTGWVNWGGQCVHFSSSYFFQIWKGAKNMPKNVVMVDFGKNSASMWAKAMDGKVTGTPKAGAISSVPGATPDDAGHTFIVDHVFSNGDILIVEQNYAPLSGDQVNKKGTWNYRYISKSTYQKKGYTFFAPSGTPNWGN